ncbi:hypothetical protein, partial [Acidovorax sp.]|uniref:hypothetical protein n=1 Tax=Acidovorax sp. TaxID=1872122 RepID=UPI00391F7353
MGLKRCKKYEKNVGPVLSGPLGRCSGRAGLIAQTPWEALHNPREDALVRIGIGHKALFAANSLAIGKKSNTVDCPSPRQRRP